MQNLAVIRWAASFGFLNCAFPGLEGKLAASCFRPSKDLSAFNCLERGKLLIHGLAVGLFEC